MLPTLLVGPLALATYPLLFIGALWLGLALAARRAGQLGLAGDHVYNAGFYGLIAGILGARLWFVLAHWENYAADLSQALSLSRSALAGGEGLTIAAVVILVYALGQKLPLGQFFDALAPGLALAVIIISIGAFLGGEGLGKSATLPWAVVIGDIARHPIQLYEAAAALLILLILYRSRAWRPWPGFHFWLLVILYGTARLLLEVFRARPTLVGDGFLMVQLLALAAIVVALAVMAHQFRRDPAPLQTEK
jgi:phosphatidylglycerol:prolipoprotein diacylglycerol transferase